MARVEKSLEVGTTPESCYQFWSRFEYLPRIMEDLIEVSPQGGDVTHWRARAPLNQEYAWDARVTRLEHNRLIAWESISGIGQSGEVRFEPIEDGCRVHLAMEVDPPRGLLGDALEQLSGEAERRVERALRNFKEVMEAGVA